MDCDCGGRPACSTAPAELTRTKRAGGTDIASNWCMIRYTLPSTSRTPRRMVRSPMRSQQPARSKLDRLTIILLVAFVVVALITAVVAFKMIYNLVVSNNTFNLPGASIDSNNPAVPPQGTVDPSIPLQEVGGPTPEPWDGVSRVKRAGDGTGLPGLGSRRIIPYGYHDFLFH